MSNFDAPIVTGSEVDLAIQRALQAAGLQGGDASSGSTFAVVGEPEAPPVELAAPDVGADGD